MRKSVLFSLIALFIWSLPIQCQNTISLSDIWKDYKYVAKRVPGFNFMNDGQHYTRLENNAIKKYDLLTGQFVNDIVKGNDLKDMAGFTGNIARFTFDKEEKKILIKSQSESIYRRSTKAIFHVYDLATQSMTAVREGEKISNATLSPDATKVAYTYMNNLYVFDLDTEETTQITQDGKSNMIINGMADWVYEEEYSFTKAFFWSPDSRQVAFMRFDETEVPEFTMTNYTGELYPEYETFKYPKVGEKNAIVTVHVYDIQSGQILDFDTDSTHDNYIPRLKWTKQDHTLMIYKMNRHQNELKLVLGNTKDGSLNTIMTEKNKYYIDITDDIRFLDNGQFIWSSEKSGYNHLYLYDLTGREMRALTSGNYDVTNFYGVDEKNRRVYYQAAEESPLQRKIYSVNLRGIDKKEHTTEQGTNSAQFSSTFDYYVNTYSKMNVPATYKVYDRNDQLIRTIEDNEKLKKKLAEASINEAEFFAFTTSDNVELNGYMIKPDGFDPSKQYPVFMYLYGGPGSQQVVDSWRGQNYMWFQHLADQGYVIAVVDNRGTGARGEEFKKMTYQQLGHYETIDQIEAAKYLGSLDYTDASRIGIFGWSYGGYMSSLCLLKGNDVFKAAIAVAPVTNWKWYDTIYTERFMRTEEENPDGYADNSPINFVDQLKGNYFLVHGNSDDNVHFQHTAEMANALIGANKQFDTYFYPNRNHGIFGNNARLHLYIAMTNFLNNKLKSGGLDNTPTERP
ncbi:MAG: S9 family peptidase [Saprospiraceae bacterium]|nr:S9 family peptidase [Saprospiraceae bacterium]